MGAVATYALLTSVFLPATVWRPLMAQVEARDHSAVPVGATAPDSPHAALQAYSAALAELADRPDLIVVAHSNAGNYLPALVNAGLATSAVFLDAVLPAHGGRWPVVPSALARELVARANSALLPPWTEWWPPAQTRALFPDTASYQAIRADEPRIPTSYLSGTLTLPDRWPAKIPAGYLAFGDTYAADRARAEQRGWPTVTLGLRHLGMLQDPVTVANELITLSRNMI